MGSDNSGKRGRRARVIVPTVALLTIGLGCFLFMHGDMPNQVRFATSDRLTDQAYNRGPAETWPHFPCMICRGVCMHTCGDRPRVSRVNGARGVRWQVSKPSGMGGEGMMQKASSLYKQQKTALRSGIKKAASRLSRSASPFSSPMSRPRLTGPAHRPLSQLQG
jgi:hypothetical protein